MNNKSTDPKAHIECLDKRESSSEKGKVAEKDKTMIEPGSWVGCRKRQKKQLLKMALTWFPGWLKFKKKYIHLVPGFVHSARNNPPYQVTVTNSYLRYQPSVIFL